MSGVGMHSCETDISPDISPDIAGQNGHSSIVGTDIKIPPSLEGDLCPVTAPDIFGFSDGFNGWAF